MDSFRFSEIDKWSLIPGILRDKITGSRYWKEHCFALNTESLIDRAAELEFVGFSYGGYNRPTPFLCLLAKMIQLEPDIETLTAYLDFSVGNPTNNSDKQKRDLRYFRALTLSYIRLVGKSHVVYRLLESNTSDYRSLVVLEPSGEFSKISVDEYIDLLLHPDNPPVWGFIFPMLTKRATLVSRKDLGEYVSPLGSELGLESF